MKLFGPKPPKKPAAVKTPPADEVLPDLDDSLPGDEAPAIEVPATENVDAHIASAQAMIQTGQSREDVAGWLAKQCPRRFPAVEDAAGVL